MSEGDARNPDYVGHPPPAALAARRTGAYRRKLPHIQRDGDTILVTFVTAGRMQLPNRLLQRRGRVWQAESFDHVLRSYESARSKGEYVCANPIRAGLVEQEDECPWLWREWVEGMEADA